MFCCYYFIALKNVDIIEKKKYNNTTSNFFGYKFYNYCLSDEERIVVSLFLVMSTTQVDKLNGWSSIKKKKKVYIYIYIYITLTVIKFIIKTLCIRDF